MNVCIRGTSQPSLGKKHTFGAGANSLALRSRNRKRGNFRRVFGEILSISAFLFRLGASAFVQLTRFSSLQHGQRLILEITNKHRSSERYHFCSLKDPRYKYDLPLHNYGAGVSKLLVLRVAIIGER